MLLQSGLYDESMRLSYLRDHKIGVYTDSLALHDGMLPESKKKQTVESTTVRPVAAGAGAVSEPSTPTLSTNAGVATAAAGGSGAAARVSASDLSFENDHDAPQRQQQQQQQRPSSPDYPLITPNECKLRTRASLLRRWGKLSTMFKLQPHNDVVRYVSPPPAPSPPPMYFFFL